MALNLHWNDGTVPKIMAVIQDEGRWADLPILADALEDAGCNDGQLLADARRGDRSVIDRVLNPGRLEALAEYLEVDPEDIERHDYSPLEFEVHGQTWLVLTDEEAAERAAEDIREHLWACRLDWLRGYLPDEVQDTWSNRVAQAFANMQERLCEDANPILAALVGDRLEDLTRDAISADGRGHFLSSYDGEEQEAGGFYLYRTN